jgi:hypothetical protein
MGDVVQFSKEELGTWGDEVVEIIRREATNLNAQETALVCDRMREGLNKYPQQLTIHLPAALNNQSAELRALVRECVERHALGIFREFRSVATEDRAALELEIVRLRRQLGAAND